MYSRGAPRDRLVTLSIHQVGHLGGTAVLGEGQLGLGVDAAGQGPQAVRAAQQRRQGWHQNGHEEGGYWRTQTR